MTQSSQTANSIFSEDMTLVNEKKGDIVYHRGYFRQFITIKGNNSLIKKLKEKSWSMIYPEGALKSSDISLGI